MSYDEGVGDIYIPKPRIRNHKPTNNLEQRVEILEDIIKELIKNKHKTMKKLIFGWIIFLKI